jgi:hypothetical protein
MFIPHPSAGVQWPGGKRSGAQHVHLEIIRISPPSFFFIVSLCDLRKFKLRAEKFLIPISTLTSGFPRAFLIQRLGI